MPCVVDACPYAYYRSCSFFFQEHTDCALPLCAGVSLYLGTRRRYSLQFLSARECLGLVRRGWPGLQTLVAGARRSNSLQLLSARECLGLVRRGRPSLQTLLGSCLGLVRRGRPGLQFLVPSVGSRLWPRLSLQVVPAAVPCLSSP